MSQILVGQSSALILTTFDGSAQEDLGTFTLGVVDSAGNEIVPAGSAVDDNGDGTYEYQLDPQDNVTLLTATWTEEGGDLEFVTWHEVVGGLLFTIHQARRFDAAKLSDEALYPDDAIAAERARVADWLEARTGRSWVPRYRRVSVRGSGHQVSLLDVSRSEGPSGGEGATADIGRILSINGEPVDDSDVDVNGWRIYWDGGVFSGRNIIEYEYGLAHVRSGADRIALLEIVDRLPATRLSRSAVSAGDELGSYGWEPQNNGRPSRVPEVNEWCRIEDQRIPIA